MLVTTDVWSVVHHIMPTITMQTLTSTNPNILCLQSGTAPPQVKLYSCYANSNGNLTEALAYRLSFVSRGSSHTREKKPKFGAHVHYHPTHTWAHTGLVKHLIATIMIR